MITALIFILIVTAFALPMKFTVAKAPVPVAIDDISATGCDMIFDVPRV